MIEYQVVLALALPLLLTPAEGWKQLKRSPITYLNRRRWMAPIGSLVIITFLIQSPSAWGMKVERSVRSFYGAYQIGTTETSRLLLHGTTVHGQQYLSSGAERIPGSYYAPGSPVANVFQQIPSDAHVAVIGLGAGEIATYSKPHQDWTFYEIDPLIVNIAQTNFKYLAQMPKPPAIVVGDGRLKVAESQEVYDTLILDAFSSDAIPLHLLTSDALEKVFLPHLSQRGTIAYHITNQYIDLEGPLERLANATGLEGLVKHDRPNSAGHLSDGSPSDWVVLTRNPSMSQALKADGWQNMKQGTSVWTDDFTNLYSALKRKSKSD